MHAYSASLSFISGVPVKSSWFVPIKLYADVYSEIKLSQCVFSITKFNNYPSITCRPTELSFRCCCILSLRWLISEHIENRYLKVLRRDLCKRKQKKEVLHYSWGLNWWLPQMYTYVCFDGIVTADCSKCVRVHVCGRLAIHSHNHRSMMALLVSEGGQRHWSLSVLQVRKSQYLGEMEGQAVNGKTETKKKN